MHPHTITGAGFYHFLWHVESNVHFSQKQDEMWTGLICSAPSLLREQRELDLLLQGKTPGNYFGWEFYSHIREYVL